MQRASVAGAAGIGAGVGAAGLRAAEALTADDLRGLLDG